MGRFGRRHTPPRVRQARKEANSVAPKGKSLLSLAEVERALWTYGKKGTDGALRLISVKKLLDSTNPVIDLLEWSKIEAWPRDDAARFGHEHPRQWPRYAAISHVWEPSEDAARISNKANRPLHIDIGSLVPHTMSWLGLAQAATVAEAHRCKYLWLDLLCLNQGSHDDKKMQIKQMSKIYSNASMVIVMPGGVVAAQGFDKPSSWINRAWTFQEATLRWPIYVLVNWSLPGSFSYFSRLNGNIAMASLRAIVEHPTGQSLGVSTLEAEGAIRQYELDSPLRCLGDDPYAISALASALPYGSEDEDGTSFKRSVRSLYDTKTSEETDTDDVDDLRASTPLSSPLCNSEGRNTQKPSFKSSESSVPTNEINNDFGETFNRISITNDWGFDDTSSESSREYPENHGPMLGDTPEIQHGAVWRSMWLRTSTKPQDLVFSMMHLLGASIDVDYTRSLKEIMFELIEKTRSTPAWMVIGYEIPVYPESGLIPILPTFTPNSNPTYLINGKTRPASEFICSGFFCDRFDIVIKSTSIVDGHLICAMIMDVKHATAPQASVKDPSFNESMLHLLCLDYEVHTKCRFKGRLGSAVVVIGDYSTLGALDEWAAEENTAFVYLLEKSENGTWQKTAAGVLDGPLLHLNHRRMIKRRHLQVGGHLGAEIAVCDCHEVLKEQTKSQSEYEDLPTALASAADAGDEQRVRQLIDLGADVNAKVGLAYGSPLLAACCRGNERIVELIITHGADINAPGQINRVELHYTGAWYGTPLQVACIRNFEPVARILIQHGANINAQGPEGTALQAAVKSKYNKQIVQLLLDHGANVNAQGGRYGNALMAAQTHLSDSRELIQLLIDNGAHVNSTEGAYNTDEGCVCRSALQMACQNGALDRVRLLIERGANVNLRTGGTFDTALQEAAYYRFPLICQTLIDSGADVHSQGGHFGNPLQAAVALPYNMPPPEFCTQIVQLILEKGADVNARGGYYGNALQAAAANPTPNKLVIELLLKKGANVNARGGHYGTALQAAAGSGHKDDMVFHILLGAGGDVNIPDGQFGCALQAAMYRADTSRGPDRIVDLLIRTGAKMNVDEEIPTRAARRARTRKNKTRNNKTRNNKTRNNKTRRK
jgi:ankyrin repeat protein